MNTIYKFILWGATALIVSAHGQRPPVNNAAPWDSLFPGVNTLIHIDDAYGKGKHRNFTAAQPMSEIVTSRLEKDGKIWEVGTKDAFYIDFYRSGGANADRERIFTSTPLIYARGSLVLVDAVEEQNEISILAAGFENYVCFKLKRKPFASPQAGFYILEPYATNSPNWYLDAVVRLDCLGHQFDGGGHSWALKSVKLSGLSGVELEAKAAPNVIESINFSTGIPLKDGISVQNSETPVPPDQPMAFHSEEAVLEFFGIPAGEDLKWRVMRVEGGKTKVFEILDQLADQTQVPAIKQRITDSIGSNS